MGCQPLSRRVLGESRTATVPTKIALVLRGVPAGGAIGVTAALLLSLFSCLAMDTNPDHRSSAVVVLGGATELRYWSEGPGREGATYAIQASPPAEEALAEVKRRLAEAGWKAVANPPDGFWRDIALRHKDGTSEPIRCWTQRWRQEGEELTYDICTESARPGLLTVGIWRRPSS